MEVSEHLADLFDSTLINNNILSSLITTNNEFRSENQNSEEVSKSDEEDIDEENDKPISKSVDSDYDYELNEDKDDSSEVGGKTSKESTPVKSKITNKNNLEQSIKIKKTVVDSEIETQKRIERGPTEAELRRIALIEIDPDELEERIEKINKVAASVICSRTGLSKEQQKETLKASREYLAIHIKDNKFEDYILEMIEKQVAVTYGNALFDQSIVDSIVNFINSDQSIEDSSDDERSKIKSGNVIPNNENMVSLSDSDSDNESDMQQPLPVLSNLIKSVCISINKPQTLRERLLERKQKMLLQGGMCQRNLSSRASLMIMLRQKVSSTATENYCSQHKIPADELKQRSEISERCRQLVHLLKEREERLTVKQQEERRLKYQAMANADEDEFDDEYLEYGDGKFMTEEEKRAILNGFQDDEDDQEDEDEDYSHRSDEGDDNDDNSHSNIRPVDEEIDAIRMHADNNDNSDNVDENASIKYDEESIRKPDSSDIDDDHSSKADNAKNSSIVTYGRKKLNQMSINTVKNSQDSNNDNDENNDLENDNSVDGENEVKNLSNNIRLKDSETTQKLLKDDSSLLDQNDDDDKNNGSKSSDEEEIHSARHSKAQKSKRVKTGNSLFRLQLEEEERRHRIEKNKSNGMFDDEAEEEEEEAHQAGLGDFGFGVTSKLRENDEEANALRLRKGDLDHIVDDLSEGEGDEEAGERARMEMDMKEDREKTKAVITAVTEGRDAVRKKHKGKYSFEGLMNDKHEKESQSLDVDNEEEEFDEEEMIQKGMKERFERDRRARALRGSDDSSDESDIEDEIDEGNIDGFGDLTEEQKLVEIEKLKRQKERDRVEALKRKQFEEYTKMRREMRRRISTISASGANVSIDQMQSISASNLRLDSFSNEDYTNKTSFNRTMSMDPPTTALIDITNANSIKRRTSIKPKHISSSHPLIRSRTNPIASGNSVPKSLYKGELDRGEVEAGYGMGMAMAPIKRSESNNSNSNGGIFTAVTGLKRSVSIASTTGNGNALRRTFTGSAKRRNMNNYSSMPTTTIPSHQFIFTSYNNSNSMMSTHDESSQLSMGGALSRPESIINNKSHALDSNHSQSAPGNSLFDKLGAIRNAQKINK
eukprot:gene13063-17507_t